MDVDGDLASMWGELESEFNNSPPRQPLEGVTLPYVERRKSFLDRFDRAFFNGYAVAAVLALVVLWVNSFHLSAYALGAHINVASALPALLLAALIAPLFGGARRPLLFSLFLAPFAAGIYCLLSALTDLTVSVLVSTKELSAFDIGSIAQSHLEAFLSTRCVIAAVLAIAFAHGLVRWRQRQLPWFETPRISNRRITVAAGLVALPLLLVLGIQVQGRILERNPMIQWYRETRRAYPGVEHFIKNDSLNRQTPWTALDRYWRKNTSQERPFDFTSKEATPDSLLQELEVRARHLLSGPASTAEVSDRDYDSIKRLLLKRRDDLKFPLETLLALLKADSGQLLLWDDAETVVALTSVLKERQLSESELEAVSAGLAVWRASRLDLLSRLDLTAAMTAGELSYYRPRDPQPLVAFGTRALYSPNQLYLYGKKIRPLEAWLSIRHSLIDKKPEQVLQLLEAVERERKQDDLDIRVLTGSLLDVAQRGSFAVAYCEAAQLVCAARLYQARHGRLPERLEELEPLLPTELETERFTLKKVQSGLEVQMGYKNARPAIWVLK